MKKHKLIWFGFDFNNSRYGDSLRAITITDTKR